MKYKQLIDMGFKRVEIFSDDQVFLDEHGYECFWLEKTLYKKGNQHVYVEWEPTKGKMELITCHKEAKITSRREITADEMKTLVTIFAREGDLPEPMNYTMLA